MKQINVPPKLAKIAGDRDHVNTSEFGRAIHRASQTVRQKHSESGACYGIRPVKVGNRLLWPVAAIAALLNGGE